MRTRSQQPNRINKTLEKQGATYLPDDILLAGVELGTLVDVVAAEGTADAHGKHHAYLDLLILGAPGPWQLRRIEIRRVVLVQDLTLSHCSEAEDRKDDDGGGVEEEDQGILAQFGLSDSI